MRRVASFSRSFNKRQRLSSPTYDRQIVDLSQDDLQAIDELEAKMTKGLHSPPKGSKHSDALMRNVIVGPKKGDEKENFGDRTHLKPVATTVPVSDGNVPSLIGRSVVAERPLLNSAVSTPSKKISSSVLPTTLASSSLNHDCLQTHSRSPSPDAPPERDYSSWFAPGAALPAGGFSTSKSLSTSSTPGISSNVSTVGFMKASTKEWVAPSREALAKAEEKMKRIWQEDGPGILEPSSVNGPSKVFMNPPSPQPALITTGTTLRHIQVLDSPSPASYKPPLLSHTPPLPSISDADQLKERRNVQHFKSSLMNSSVAKGPHPPVTSIVSTSSPLKPNRSTEKAFTSTGFQHPPSSAAISAPPPFVGKNQAEGTYLTPMRPTRTPARSKFVTPFKSGMKPGERGRNQSEGSRNLQSKFVKPSASNDTRLTRDTQPPPRTALSKSKERKKFFNLAKPPNRLTLASSGLTPQFYCPDELEAMGINTTELSQISPSLAIYYSFHTASAIPMKSSSLSPPTTLGPSAALSELLSIGCTLATKPWVDNHWCLILWKMAGIAFLDPQRERDPNQKVWCWSSVMRQLLYRYERELNGGSRPPLRRVATHDSPASLPMVLCVSNVTWSEAGIDDDGLPIIPHPELEVTDGWYRVRARVDAPLAKAVRKGIIRVGRKIAVAGARLWSERKEPREVLESYNSTKLVLSGNSSHLAPWHAKLGFQAGIYIATLNSLTPDGGVIAVMDLVVLKVHPIAFIEFFEDKDGKKHKEGPFNEREEAAVSEKWKKRREAEVSKLQVDFESQLSRFEDYANRLERRAGPQFNPGVDDSPPDHIESLYEDLEDSTEASMVLGRLSGNEAGWLARYIRDRIKEDLEKASDRYEGELTRLCPPREVKNFQVLVVQDARTQRQPSNRVAQLTVWDVLGLTRSEESNNESFEVGQRFRVTNLIPTQQKAWMGREAGSEVYLSTRRDSKWTRMQ